MAQPAGGASIADRAKEMFNISKEHVKAAMKNQKQVCGIRLEAGA
jgi:hypothetical protein